MANTIRRLRRDAPWTAAALLAASPAAATQDGAVLEAALRFFTRQDATGIVERFESGRPGSVSPAERERALATLPSDGDVRDLDERQRRKLASARRVLQLNGRDATYELKVIAVPQAAVALHARAVLLVSAPALALLEPDELQALVAHEVGHEYFWGEYARARADDDRPLLRKLELLCDGVAVLTLRRAGMDPGRLTSAIEKVLRYNRERFGPALNEGHYPTAGERRTFARRLVAWLGRTEVH
jgi:hypothetical protein